ncbi:MAG: iron export ABC transporter permease subunit FetB [Cyanobacteria bacterium J083]|nr:MAG: iron export ABC transporter permease subunit FetB [Cyanobacteria bacterium J083]
MNSFIALDLFDLPLALGLIGCAIALSVWQKLGLASQLIFAAFRALLQLLIVGYILAFIFAVHNVWAVLAILAVMLTIAALVARNRIIKQAKNLLPIVWGSLLASASFSIGYGILLIIQPENWYEPQYLIPLAGMVLGNAMNAASLAGERLVSRLKQNRLEIETYLCLGATPKIAINNYQREAIRASLIPTLNQMMVAGLVSLPGMFTGQVLAGIDPLNAVSYQILILFMIAVSNLIAAILVTEGVYRQFFNLDWQLKF